MVLAENNQQDPWIIHMFIKHGNIIIQSYWWQCGSDQQSFSGLPTMAILRAWGHVPKAVVMNNDIVMLSWTKFWCARTYRNEVRHGYFNESLHPGPQDHIFVFPPTATNPDEPVYDRARPTQTNHHHHHRISYSL